VPLQINEYPIPASDRVEIEMPVGAWPLSVDARGPTSNVVLSALVDPGAPKAKRAFRVFLPGVPFEIDPATPYVGLVKVNGGKTVWHVFDLGEVR
jgi:hypothetical protein